MADEVFRRRGTPIDFLDLADQELLLRWLHCRLVRYADKSVRFAVKLDKDWDRQDSEAVLNPLARMLAAPAGSDPLVLLLDAEREADRLAVVAHSYSQASAYLILLHRFDWDFDDLSGHLQLTPDTVRHKVARCGVHMRQQPSLFDGIESIARDFAPRIARRRIARPH